MWSHAAAIIWAQWRIGRNYVPRSNKIGLAFSGVLTLAWYSAFLLVAVVVGVLLSKPDELEFIDRVFPTALFICFLYWQVIPVFLASMGVALDLRKLLVYPIPNRELFTLEVLLRTSTGIEMLLVLTGAGIGLLLNPRVPFWAAPTLILFVVFNLLCSAGVRDLLVRLFARKRIREIVTLLFVLAAALPQLMLLSGFGNKFRGIFTAEASPYLPWTAAARLAEGIFTWTSVAVALGWTVAAYVFGRWQFERTLQFDFREAAAASRPPGRTASRLDWFYRLPNAILPDPLAALVEKELRSLTRTPRFRLVFLMGFSFGILIWFPVAFGSRSATHSWMGDNYLTLVSVYALLLLSDTLFWNVFGFDRSAAQVYFLVPVKMSTVLVGKNLTAAWFVLMDIGGVAIVCALLRLPVSGIRILEAFAVALMVATILVAIGNLSSLYNPRRVNPDRALRNTAGARIQALVMLLFPVALSPVVLAYLARYAFDSEWAFFAVLLAGAMLGALLYRFSMESAVQLAERRKEQIIATLGQGDGLVET